VQAVRGFSLLEIVIAMALAGILLAAAMPSYSSYMQRTRRSDAANALAQVQLAQERWRGNNSTYASSMAALGLSSASPQGHYTVAVTSASANGYAATATASSALQVGDTDCRTLGLLMAGGNLSYQSGNADGSSDPSGQRRCWVR
jgi:type IV pilus assembly protein PilE